MILPTILYTLKGKILLGTAALFTTVAVTEAFLGQILNSLISAVPPLIAIWFLARNQNRERAAGNRAIIEGQKEVATEVAKAVDGQLSKYVVAKEQIGHAAGMEQERKEQRSREGEAAIAQQASPPLGIADPPSHKATAGSGEGKGW